MKIQEIKSAVIDLISELFSKKIFDKSIIESIDLIDGAGMDSITFISLVVEIEDKFGITITDDALLLENFKDVDSIVNIVNCEVSRTEETINNKAWKYA